MVFINCLKIIFTRQDEKEDPQRLHVCAFDMQTCTEICKWESWLNIKKQHITLLQMFTSMVKQHPFCHTQYVENIHRPNLPVSFPDTCTPVLALARKILFIKKLDRSRSNTGLNMLNIFNNDKYDFFCGKK